MPKITPSVTRYFLPKLVTHKISMFVDRSLIDSITDSCFAKTADTGCDWLKQLKRFTAFWMKQNSFETVSFQFHFNCADSLTSVMTFTTELHYI